MAAREIKLEIKVSEMPIFRRLLEPYKEIRGEDRQEIRKIADSLRLDGISAISLATPASRRALGRMIGAALEILDELEAEGGAAEGGETGRDTQQSESNIDRRPPSAPGFIAGIAGLALEAGLGPEDLEDARRAAREMREEDLEH